MLYVKQQSVHFDLEWTIDERRLLEEPRTDGIFPLVTNDTQLGPLVLLRAYKRPPQIEKRSEQ